MSEYQYYEFQAIDRHLTSEQMAKLRAITSRATITPTRLTNVYHWGDFQGDPIELLTDYFDAHLYEANWGSHTLAFGFPRKAVDLTQLQAYRVDAISDYEAGLMVMEHRDRVILTFASHDEDGGGWLDEVDSEAWLPAMISLRADILNGDLRALYLGWLAGATLNLDAYDEVVADDPDEADEDIDNSRLREPPVPPGLKQLTPALQKLAEFLRLEPSLIDVAAERSSPLTETRLPETSVREWLSALPTAEKDAFLLRLIEGESQVGPELVRRLRSDLVPKAEARESSERRTAGDLAHAGEARMSLLARRADEEKARERARHLASLKGKEDDLWQEADDLVSTKRQHEYDAAVTLLKDLRDLAARSDQSADFGDQLSELRLRHKSKVSFVDRLNRAGLR